MHESTTSSAPTSEIDSEQLAYKVPRVAEILDISVRKAWSLVHSGEIESFRIGSSRRIPRQSVVDYVEARRRAAA